MHSRSPRRDRRMFTLVALSISALAFTACAGTTDSDPSPAAEPTMPVVQDAADLVPAAIKDKGVLTVVMPTNEPPMQFYKQGTKDMTGVNADIARLLASALGLGIDIQIANFDALIPGLAAGRYDATVSSMTPTEERMQTLDFVEYMNIGSAVGALEETDVSIDDMCGRSVALLSGSYQLSVNIPLIDEACTSGGEQPVDVMVFADTPGHPGRDERPRGRRVRRLHRHRIRGRSESRVRRQVGIRQCTRRCGHPARHRVARAGHEGDGGDHRLAGVHRGTHDLRPRVGRDHRSRRQRPAVTIDPLTATRRRKMAQSSIDQSTATSVSETLTSLTVKKHRPVATIVGGILVAVIVVVFLIDVPGNPGYGWPTVLEYLFAPEVLQGVLLTIILTVIAQTAGIVLGVLLAVMRVSRNPVFSWVAAAYIWFFRGTPLLVQLIFWYNIAALYPTIAFGLPLGGPSIEFGSANVLITPLAAALLGLSLNEGAYMAEIVRSGINSVDAGQLDAGRAIGMTGGKLMRRVILPQAMRVVIPPTGNEVISMLKSTSLVSVLAISDLLYSVQTIYAINYQVIPLLLVACAWYLLMTSILTAVQSRIEAYYGRGFDPRARTGRLRGRRKEDAR